MKIFKEKINECLKWLAPYCQKIYTLTLILLACSLFFTSGLFIGQFKQPLPYVSIKHPLLASKMAIVKRQQVIGTNEYQRDDLFFDKF